MNPGIGEKPGAKAGPTRKQDSGNPEKGLKGEKGKEQGCHRVVWGSRKRAFVKNGPGVTGQATEDAGLARGCKMPAYGQFRPQTRQERFHKGYDQAVGQKPGYSAVDNEVSPQSCINPDVRSPAANTRV